MKGNDSPRPKEVEAVVVPVESSSLSVTGKKLEEVSGHDLVL
jgi:hypothetical protein